MEAASTSPTRSQGRLSVKSFITLINRESKDLLISSRQVLSTSANGKEGLEMDMVSRLGQMELASLESGKKTERMEREDSST